MIFFRTWAFLVALTASSALLFGGSPTWKLLVTDFHLGRVFPIDLPDKTVGVTADNISGAWGIVITPDATKAVVSCAPSSGKGLFLLDLTTDSLSEIISVQEESLCTCAISPDGTKIYSIRMTGKHGVLVHQTSDLSLIATISLNNAIKAIVLSPNKPEGYIITGDNIVYIFNTETNTVTGEIGDLPSTYISSECITPDGTELYLGFPEIQYVTLSDSNKYPVTGLPDAVLTYDLEMSPDGSTLFAIRKTEGGEYSLVKVDTSTHSYVMSYPIPPQITAPVFAHITPDGKTLCIINHDVDGQLVFIDLITGESTELTLPSATVLYAAITPDQAPRAQFTVSANGLKANFDASASSSPVGEIALYTWDFGDGQIEATSSPAIAHTYKKGGAATVTLTVTNTAGTSSDVVYTGQTVTNNGSPSAVAKQTLWVRAVSSLKGKIHRHHKPYMSTWWSKSSLPHTRKYQIFAWNKKVATVKAHHEKYKAIRLHPKHKHVWSKEYRHYLENKYNIRAVDASGFTSEPTFVRVKKS